MKHLNDEERLAFVEGRASKETADHVAQCAECAAEVDSWRRTINRLEHFEWSARQTRRSTIVSPAFKWALAAGLVLCVGFGLGRFSGPNAAEIQASVKAEVSRDLQKQLAMALREQRKSQVDSNAILGLLADLRDQQDRNYISLRKDLETLASTADARLQSTRRQMLEIAQNFSDPIH
jgi:hypothetical protein